MPEVSSARIDEGFAPAQSPSVYAVELDGEAVLLDEAANRLHLLNHTATLVWTLFDGQTTIAELAVDVSGELDAPYDTVVDDIVAIARHLGDEGLLAEVRPALDTTIGADGTGAGGA